MIEDRFLVWRFNRGDTAALCRIYEKYRDDLLKVAAALLSDKSGGEDVLSEFKEIAQGWHEEIRKDPETGKSYAYITFSGPAVNTAKHWQIQVDLETKLPVRTAVWFSEDRQGQPHYEFTKLK